MPNETAAFFCWVFLKCLPTLLGKENLSRAKLLITDGDSAEFEAVEESIFAHFSQAIRGRCCHHVVQKTFEKSVNEGSMPHPTLAGSFLREVKTWIHSWSDGSSCFTKEQCELSKDLLIHTIQNDNNARRVFGSAGCKKVVAWIEQRVVVHESTTAMWKKRLTRCFDECVNNSGEAMNRSCKKSDVSAKPNMNMSTAAGAMLAHSRLKAKDRKGDQARLLASTPLFIQPGKHKLEVLQKLCNMARHMVIQQFRGEFQLKQTGPKKAQASLSPICFCCREKTSLCSADQSN